MPGRERSAPRPPVASSGVRFDPDARLRVERVASALDAGARERRARTWIAWMARAGVHPGWAVGPTLWVEDHRGIALVPESAAAGFEYRILALAGDDDFALVSRERDAAYERYLAGVPGLGAPRVLRVAATPGSPGRSLCATCLDDRTALGVLVAAARRAGGFNLAPFIADGHAWHLAARVAAAAGVPVRVAAPPPPLARAANDKLWFARAVRALLGERSLAPTWQVHGPAVAAARLVHLARAGERVVLKVPSSAGALGNVVLDPDALLGRPLADVRAGLLEALAATGWNGSWPLLAGVWESGALSSPSAQTWIPRPGLGPPVVEGVYEQRTLGVRGIFVGAAGAKLPDLVRERIEREALLLATLLQRLGYCGRASFDALLVGDDPSGAELHWIECNARWGGVSIPMGVAHRLGVRHPERRTVIGHAPVPPGARFDAVLGASAPLLFDPGRGGIVWLTPPYPSRGSLAYLSIGAHAAGAAAFAASAVDALATIGSAPDGAAVA